MRVEITAALVAGGLGLGGSAWLANIESSSKAKESVIRLGAVAESINKQLIHMREDMKNDRQMVLEMMVDHNARLKVLESRQ